MATALNVYCSSALAHTSVVVPSSILGTDCTKGFVGRADLRQRQLRALSADKAALPAVQDICDDIVNNNQLTC